MKLTALREYHLGSRLGQVRSVPVRLAGRPENAVLFVYSSQPNIDPWPELFDFPKDTLKMALFSESGMLLWERDLGTGVIPGVWFTPFISFDLDGDGTDEIWLLNNLNPHLPFSLNSRVLERIDPRSGEATGRWPWPDNTINDTMSHSYRFYITAGYVHGEPVLVTAQGTYANMYLQCHDAGMNKRWDIVIGDDGSARASHLCPVLDFNDDGVDELFWGERLISLEDGHELFCADKGRYLGHSDIVLPFIDPKSGKKYIYTCREDYEQEGEPRVITYDAQGSRVWTAVESVGHMHNGWLANIGPEGRKVAMAMRINHQVINNTICDTEPTDFYFDAVTGQPLPQPLPFKGSEYMPVDFNGDYCHEFYSVSGENAGWVRDAQGNYIAYLGGEQVRSGKLLNHPGEQMMLFYPQEGTVRIWGDPEAREVPAFTQRYPNYVDMPGSPLYPFGFGLSYTKFSYSDLQWDRVDADAVEVRAVVKNTGSRGGFETAQCYIRDNVAGVTLPVRQLKGYQKCFLSPGEAQIVRFRLDRDLLSFYNRQGERVFEPGSFTVWVGPNCLEGLQGSFNL